MSSVISGRERVVLAKSEPAGERSSGDVASARPDADAAPTVAINPTLAPTVRRPLAAGVERPDSGAATGARLLRIGTGVPFVIRDGTAMIGRDRDAADLVVSGPAVSRRHGILRRSMGRYVLTDVSRNGTYVNGRRVRGVRVLRGGDVLRIGDEEFRFEVNRATPYVGVALPSLIVQRAAQLRRALPLTALSRRIAKVLRERAGPALSRAQTLGRLGWRRTRRTFWETWAKAVFVWKARGR